MREYLELLFKTSGFKEKIKNIVGYRKIKKNDLFDYDFYFSKYSNFTNKNNLLVDYILYGSKKGKKPWLFSKDLDKYELYDSTPLITYVLSINEEKALYSINKNIYDLINNSKLFDKEYYKITYPNVNYDLYDPITHYVNVGYKKGYNPSVSFSTEGYYRLNGDVRNAGVNPLVHYLRNGEKEDRPMEGIDTEEYNIIKNSVFFDANYYIKKYPEVNMSKYDPVLHYLTIGYKKGYNPSVHFSNNWYYNVYSDVKAAKINPLFHYHKYGIKEKRLIQHITINSKNKKTIPIKQRLLKYAMGPKSYLFFNSKLNFQSYWNKFNVYNTIKNSGLFDYNYYKCTYPESNTFDNDLVLHYMFKGVKKGYKPNKKFDTNYYSNKYGNKLNPLFDYISSNMINDISFNQFVTNNHDHELIETSDLFDKEYYLMNYPEVSSFDLDPIMHYLKIGVNKGYNPSDKFNTSLYLDTYPDIRNTGINPLVHYIKFGQFEDRLCQVMTEDTAKRIMEKLDKNARKVQLHHFNENSPLVSIIILNRNGIDYLKTLFEDFADTICYPNYEIIVIDNDSTDKSVDYLKSLSKSLPLKIIENDHNESFSEANNKGVNISNGEYVLLLNNDMKPIYGWLNHMMDSYMKSDNIGIVGSKLIYPYRENNFTSLLTQNEGIKFMEYNGFLNKDDGFIVPYNIKENDIESVDEDEEIASVLGASLLIKKDLYQEVDGLDDHFFYNYEDIDLCFKVIEKGYKIIYAPKSKLYHYYQATRLEAFDISPNDMKNRTYLYYKWNKWLCEKLFLDRLNNELVFSQNPLKISMVLSNPNNLNDPLIDYRKVLNYDYNKKSTKKDRNVVKINKLGWELELIKNNNQRQAIRNSNIILSDSYNVNPKSINKNITHCVNVALINSNTDRWISYGHLKQYDLILIEEKIDSEKILNNITDDTIIVTLNNESLFLQIKSNLLKIHMENKDLFNKFISNPDFVNKFPDARNYLSIAKSNYFDEKWYTTNYDIENDKLDPVSHYLKLGVELGYDPSESFSNEKYYKANDDLKKAQINPLAHYERFGKSEGRNIDCSFKNSLLDDVYSFLTQDKIFNVLKRLIKPKSNQILFYSPWDMKIHGKLNENSQIVYDNLGNKYNKLYYTKKRVNMGEHLNLLKKILRSKVIVIDTGFGLLADLKLNKKQKVIQLWHACGAFKTVAYDSPVYTKEQRISFKKEFEQYTNFIVSSEDIIEIYANAHGLDNNAVLPLGVPRTDVVLDKKYQQEKLSEFYEKYPNLKNKKIILYAPTFRDTYKLNTKINWDNLSNSLNDEIIIIKRHFRMSEDLLNGTSYDNIIYMDNEELFTLMFASKMMITDYSSVIFEYSLLNKPVIHYCPDYDKYLSIRNFYLDFSTELYGNVVKDPDELISMIINKEYSLNYSKLNAFKNKYMSACDGSATKRVTTLIKKYMDG